MRPYSLQRLENIVSACVLPLLLHDETGLTRRNITVDNLVVAGWTGRDRAAVEHHIKELAAIGVKPPATTPIFYRASAARLTIAESMKHSARRRAGKVNSCCCKAAAG